MLTTHSQGLFVPSFLYGPDTQNVFFRGSLEDAGSETCLDEDEVRKYHVEIFTLSLCPVSFIDVNSLSHLLTIHYGIEELL